MDVLLHLKRTISASRRRGYSTPTPVSQDREAVRGHHAEQPGRLWLEGCDLRFCSQLSRPLMLRGVVGLQRRISSPNNPDNRLRTTRLGLDTSFALLATHLWSYLLAPQFCFAVVYPRLLAIGRKYPREQGRWCARVLSLRNEVETIPLIPVVEPAPGL